jgi:GDPmannose 4,6-dehydratase
LGWVPRVHAPDLARLMVDADIAALAEPGHWVDSVSWT